MYEYSPPPPPLPINVVVTTLSGNDECSLNKGSIRTPVLNNQRSIYFDRWAKTVRSFTTVSSLVTFADFCYS